MRRSAAPRPVAAVALLVFALNGCFSYVPLNGAAPAPGTRVRVDLQTPQPVVSGDVTANDVVSLIGEVVSADSVTLVLSATQLTTRTGYEHVGRGETARLPRANVARISQNRLSPVRTALVAGVVLVLGGSFASHVRPPRGNGGGGGSGSAN